ncbi:biotin-dependent carboxyltransferase family protein [Sabulilitoribacter arenilitoris]|uniref:Biotin-dependent carboxyltransferase family protein n=1 Tax=Wocania arenilitoris TaxID=2044858 RepID=A0AAE3EM58_9FLAO|nr:biotin-dependent carboxyltransferase family protein [Wocania arenilitoris]MCF7567961.1 biotin-dependent carboxyltransferase family protein [Wocania arenilitoris]
MVKVIKSGFYSTIQDFGRIGYQHLGVPYSGVLDCYSASIANAILGNNKGAAVMEMTMVGVTLQFDCNTNICITGADMSPKINSNAIRLYKAIAIKAGDVLSFGKVNYGFRSYLAVSEGFKTEVVMKSRSMYKGVTNKFVLKENDELSISNAFFNNKKNAIIKVDRNYFTSKIIEVFKGPEFACLSKEQQKMMFSKIFTISKENNRMAYQLKESLANNLKPIITSSVLPGTVQLTPSGKLIILMKDCQTTGGYPRVLQLKESSVGILSQKFTGQSISFKLLEY